jgi:hypothetical protein
MERAATDWFRVDCSHVAWCVHLSLSFASTATELLLSQPGSQLSPDTHRNSLTTSSMSLRGLYPPEDTWTRGGTQQYTWRYAANIRNDNGMKIASGTKCGVPGGTVQN